MAHDHWASQHNITIMYPGHFPALARCIPTLALSSHSCAEGSTILLASRTMLGECCLAAIQPKGFWTKLRAQERERERVCVCVCEREREGE